ncbi:hypothetical protein [Chitinophaga sp. CF418]|uniref:hypothetical protein n=1 Tax=Chitinophaga sp. CF418 TaxID=1855287 RepID=UPI000921ED61|nr:hypothetical protein [Chitinophaga sp. CF418]SHN43668.1 hypothetical protein SAMN05216311_11613 [Chitinophaga sp. CF418]
MRPIPICKPLFFAASLLAFTACQKKEKTIPAAPSEIITPVDTMVFNPIIASISRFNGELRDTFIYDENYRLIEYYYTNYSQNTPRISGKKNFAYDKQGKLTRVSYPNNYHSTATYYKEDSLVMTAFPSNYRTRYKLDTSGLPIKVYNYYYTSDTIQRINFSWEINAFTGNADVQSNYYYPIPNYDPLPYYNKIEYHIFEYNNIENPLNAIARYNPVFTHELTNTPHLIPSMSRYMMSAYYRKDFYDRNVLIESYKYTLDSMGKYPVRQVEYFTNIEGTKDSNVAIFIYRNAKQ